MHTTPFVCSAVRGLVYLNNVSLPDVMLAHTFHPRYPYLLCPQGTFYQTMILESFDNLKGCLLSGYKVCVRDPQAALQAAAAARKCGLLAPTPNHPFLGLAEVFMQPYREL